MVSRRLGSAAILRSSAPAGPGWVYGIFARRTYRRRLGFARYDLAVSAEGDVLILLTGWRFVGWRGRVALVELLAEGWLPRPHGLHRT